MGRVLCPFTREREKPLRRVDAPDDTIHRSIPTTPNYNTCLDYKPRVCNFNRGPPPPTTTTTTTTPDDN